MRRKFFAIVLLMVFLGGCSTVDQTEETSSESVISTAVVEVDSKETDPTEEISHEVTMESDTAEFDGEENVEIMLASNGFVAVSLGTPNEESFSKYMVNAKNPWDMILEGKRLYVGSGDFSINAGPVDIWCYDIEKAEWEKSGRASDEAIQRFVRVGDKVMAPGLDSKGNWAYGNYYTLEDGAWEMFYRVPDTIHMFDIVEYEGGRFYGIGTDTDETSPVLLTMDNDETFIDVPFMKDGEELFGNGKYGRCRVYDFFVLEGKLYCTCEAFNVEKSVMTMDAIFIYENNAFSYICDSTINIGSTQARQIHIYDKVFFDGAYYYANGKLKKTFDLQEIEILKMPENCDVEDVLVDYNEENGEEEMYILTKKRSGEVYRSVIWKYIDDENFEEVCYLESLVPAMSFAKYGDDFFVGLGLDIGDYKTEMNLGEIVHLVRQ